jgi:putative flippase GtrA
MMAGRAAMLALPTPALLRRTGVRQLVKFCLVGASSTVIDKGVLWLLLNDLAPAVPWWASATVSFSLAVTNGFVWNRLWTFRARAHASASAQYTRFFAVNVVGLVLNLGLTKAFLVVFTGRLLHLEGNPDARTVLLASLSAVPFVTLWNFGASKYWTFRHPGAGGRRVHPRRAAAHEPGVQPSTRTRR